MNLRIFSILATAYPFNTTEAHQLSELTEKGTYYNDMNCQLKSCKIQCYAPSGNPTQITFSFPNATRMVVTTFGSLTIYQIDWIASGVTPSQNTIYSEGDLHCITDLRTGVLKK